MYEKKKGFADNDSRDSSDDERTFDKPKLKFSLKMNVAKQKLFRANLKKTLEKEFAYTIPFLINSDVDFDTLASF